jgi:hypothetical protein
MSKKIYFQYTPPAKTAWDELPMSEKADIMKSCIRNGIISPLDKDGVIKPLIYPNGRIVDISGKSANDTEFKLIKRAKYNNVFYDPASMVEYNWQIANGLQ